MRSFSVPAPLPSSPDVAGAPVGVDVPAWVGAPAEVGAAASASTGLAVDLRLRVTLGLAGASGESTAGASAAPPSVAAGVLRRGLVVRDAGLRRPLGVLPPSSDSGATSPAVDAEASPTGDTDDPPEERPRPFSEAPSLTFPFAGSAWVPRPLGPSLSAGREASEASSAPGLGTAFRPGRAARAARKSSTSPPPAGADAPPPAWPPWEVP